MDRLVDRLRAMPASARHGALMTFLREHIAGRLNVHTGDIEPRAALMALGMSSLQSVEVKMHLEVELGTRLPTSLVFDYPTLELLVPHILMRVGLAVDAQTAVERRSGAQAHRAERMRGGFGEQSVEAELALELLELRRQGEP